MLPAKIKAEPKVTSTRGRGKNIMSICKGTCVNYKAPGKSIGMKYGPGIKRCTECGVMIKWDGKHCPCCSVQMRRGPRSRKYKREVIRY